MREHSGVWYAVSGYGEADDGGPPENTHWEEFDGPEIDLEGGDSLWRDSIIEACAAEYHNYCDGWEDSWPLTFWVSNKEDGPWLAKALVEREAEPVFYSHKIETNDA